MHILTGMLVAGLFGRGKSRSLLPLLRFGPVQTAHCLPGRVRFRVPCLAEDESRADLLCEKLPTLQGVESVTVTPGTGSVLVCYEEERVNPELLYAAVVRLAGVEKQLVSSPPPAVVKEMRTFIGSLNRVIYDRTGGVLDFASAVLILLAAIGIVKSASEGRKSLPSGFTLLWWSIHQMLGHAEE